MTTTARMPRKKTSTRGRSTKARDPERIMTLHPDGKQGVNITRDKYDAVRTAILRDIRQADDREQGAPLKGMGGRIAPHLPEGLFPDGKGITWYVMAVKQDLETRGEIKQVPGAKPQRLFLAGQ